jgi:signal transduction histidine kinase
MERITNIEEAEKFIYDYNWFEQKSNDQEQEYKLLKTCEELAETNKNKKLLCKTRAFLTSYYAQNNNLQDALDIGIKNYLLAKTEHFQDELLLMFSFLINTYQLLGDYAQAEEYLIQCKEYVLQLNDDRRKCSTYIVSANQYFYIKNYEECYKEFETALKYGLKIKDAYILANLYNNYGMCLIEKNLIYAETILNNGLEIIKSEGKNKNIEILLGYCLCNLALLFQKKREYGKCMDFVTESIKIFRKNKNQIELLEAKIIYANTLLNIKNYTKCKKVLNEIERDAIASSANEILLRCYKLYYEVYQQKNRYKEAFHLLLKYHELNERIFNEESNQKIRNLQISHEVKTISMERENAERVAKLKHDFLANMSHEIRTPVNSILGISYLLEQDKLTAKQHEYVRRLHINAEGLLSIINDVLDISKIEAGKLDIVYQPFSLLTCLQNMYLQFEQKAKDKEIEFLFRNHSSLDETILVVGDMNRVRQILINLVGNAFKFTEKGKIELELNEEEKGFTIRIKDTGIGIAPEKAAKLFERYTQAEKHTSMQFGGTGLGLAISKRLAEMMNGQIELKSQPNVGTEFILTLPFRLARGTYETSSENEQLEVCLLSGMELLIADDNSESRITTRDLLQHFNPEIRITEAENGKEALESAKHRHPRIILMDLDMPEMNGMEATVTIRKDNTLNDVRIIATTAGLLSISKEELLSYGFDDLIFKPYNPENLVKVLLQHLHH